MSLQAFLIDQNMRTETSKDSLSEYFEQKNIIRSRTRQGAKKLYNNRGKSYIQLRGIIEPGVINAIKRITFSFR